MPESRLVVTAMLDFQNLRDLGKGGMEGKEEKTAYFSFSFFFQPNAHIVGPPSALPSPPQTLLLTSKMVAVALNQLNNMPPLYNLFARCFY